MDKNKKIFGIAIISFMIVAMLSVGLPAYQQIQAGTSINKIQNTQNECLDCTDLSDAISKILQSNSEYGKILFEIDLDDLPEFDESFLCEVYSDEEAYQYVMDSAATGLLGCGMSYSFVYVDNPSIAESEMAVSQYTRDILSFDAAPIDITTIRPTVPDDTTSIQSRDGHWEVQIDTFSRTPEEVMTQATALYENCQGGEPQGLIDWDFEHAVAFCTFIYLSMIQVPLYIIHTAVWLLSLAVCIDGAVYTAIDQVLDNYDVSMVELVGSCVEALMG